ncbi:hypothetical protein ABEW34_24380 [Paenibacillus algorifonticola]|uniref:hypothetical protein n=1 Tax=Paenibacillus algorifonticola TaxID=684063 RepID=UPI003D282941
MPDGGIRDLLCSIRDGGAWKPIVFTDAVARQVSGRAVEETRGVLEYIQHIEISELLEYTISAAIKKA